MRDILKDFTPFLIGLLFFVGCYWQIYLYKKEKAFINIPRMKATYLVSFIFIFGFTIRNVFELHNYNTIIEVIIKSVFIYSLIALFFCIKAYFSPMILIMSIAYCLWSFVEHGEPSFLPIFEQASDFILEVVDARKFKIFYMFGFILYGCLSSVHFTKQIHSLEI